MEFIPVYIPYQAYNQRSYVLDCLDTNWISGKGKYIELFEEELANYLGVSSVIAVSNGTVSLMLIYAALGIGVGSEVITPSLTYCATVSQLNWLGAKAVLVDSDDNYQMDLSTIDKLLAENSKIEAIVVPQLYGDSPDMIELQALAKKHEVHLIEDSAECFGCAHNLNQMIGSFGVASSFSFFSNKTVCTGEGGAVATDDENLARSLRLLRSQAHIGNFKHDGPGFNFRMTNIQAAIGLAQLEDLQTILEKKAYLASYYRKNLSPQVGKILPKIYDSAEWMPLFTLPETIDYSRFMYEMRSRSIETRPCFTPIHIMAQESSGNLWKGFDYDIPGEISNCEKIYKRGFNLPSYPDLTEEQLKYIVDCTNEVVELVG